jgi:flagellin
MARIYNNTMANTAYKNYSVNNNSLMDVSEKLSTGLRINRGKDDPAGLAISSNLRATIAGSLAAVDTIDSANNFMAVADGALQTVHDTLNRLEELAIRFNDGSLSTADKSDVVTEFNALKSEIDSVFANTKFNGAVVFTSTTRGWAVDASSTQAYTVGTNSLMSQATTAIGTITTTSAASTLISSINTFVTSISTQRAYMGADMSRLAFKRTNQMTLAENLQAFESRVRDADFALESAKFAKYQVLVQSTSAMLAQANAQGANVLQLLR